ncbi:unnamed protein product [Thlaspi arvense]|uniref:SWIM-type domain-containing protein n=1 Tax=Thlaspi arvense TaxID=13288 RepID=A0AAU9SIQ2_THLAR|nr:unnamed protein product [Thlaspi arvense]
MSRIVEVRVGMSLLELKTAVVKEFFPEAVDSVEASLSYWPPNTTELATGITTPPVLVTNNRAVVFFFRHFMVKGSASERLRSKTSFVGGQNISRDNEGAIPGPLSKRRLCGSSSGSQAHNGGAQRVGSYAVPFDLDEVEILKVVETAEEKYFSEKVIRRSKSSSLGTDDSDSKDYCGELEDDREREVLCSTNDAFDHRVRVGGDLYRDDMFKKEASPFTFSGTAGDGSGGEGSSANRDPFVPLDGGQTPHGHGVGEEEVHGQFNGGQGDCGYKGSGQFSGCHMEEVRGSRLNEITDWRCQVVGPSGEQNSVNMTDRKCSCKKYDRLKIPCGHGLLVGDSLGLLPSTLVGATYRVGNWRETYAGVISPIISKGDEEVPAEISKLVLLPPRSRRGAGRRKTERIPSVGEMPVALVKKEVPNRCSKCLQPRHNRTSCMKQK